MCVAHGEGEVRSEHVGKTRCSSWDWTKTEPQLAMEEEDPSKPSAPAIPASWSMEPGTMTTIHPRSHDCVYVR